jgi:hypothetical protein
MSRKAVQKIAKENREMQRYETRENPIEGSAKR